MGKYIQSTNVDSTNNTLHFRNLEIADLISQIFNTHLINQISNFIYDGNTSQVTPRSEGLQSKIISQQINCFINWNNNFSDRNDYLNGYLVNDCFPLLETENRDVVFPLFTDLYLEHFLDDISAKSIEDKLNEKINSLR
jgi:hypothetical protein